MITVNSLWIGNKLSTMEILSIRSHLAQGHTYNLWCYEEVEGVPDGTNVVNGGDILGKDQIFCYQAGTGKGSYSAFSNIFRYKLLYDRGGWWVDTDVVAIKPFEFEPEYVFSSERAKANHFIPTTCVIKLPIGSEIARQCYETAITYDQKTLEWGTIGPLLLDSMINAFNLNHLVTTPEVFCPVDWFHVKRDILDSEGPDTSGSYSIHLWNEMWRQLGINKNTDFERQNLYERLKSSYLCTHPENSRKQHRHLSGGIQETTSPLLCPQTHVAKTRLVRML